MAIGGVGVSAWSNCSERLHDDNCTFTDIFVDVLRRWPWSQFNDYDLRQRRYHEAIDLLHDLCDNIYPGRLYVAYTAVACCVQRDSLKYRHFSYRAALKQLSPRRRRDDMPPPMAVRLAADRPTSVRGRFRSPRMAKLQAASVPIDWAPARLGQTDGRIAVSLNACNVGGIITP